MNRFTFLLLFSILISILACNKKDVIPAKEKQWIKVEISGEHAQIYSIYGDISQSLFVTMYGKILKSTDSAKTWVTKLNVDSDFGKLEFSKDTLFAIGNGDDYYSVDGGELWLLLGRDLPLVNDLKATSSTGIRYWVKGNFSGELALPSDVLESCDGGKSWKNIFPYQYIVSSILLDPHDVLYIGVANTLEWNQALGSFEEKINNNAAFYYWK